ncbi:unnamed protein product, partial [Prorocentrum cordatum]
MCSVSPTGSGASVLDPVAPLVAVPRAPYQDVPLPGRPTSVPPGEVASVLPVAARSDSGPISPRKLDPLLLRIPIPQSSPPLHGAQHSQREPPAEAALADIEAMVQRHWQELHGRLRLLLGGEGQSETEPSQRRRGGGGLAEVQGQCSLETRPWGCATPRFSARESFRQGGSASLEFESYASSAAQSAASRARPSLRASVRPVTRFFSGNEPRQSESESINGGANR